MSVGPRPIRRKPSPANADVGLPISLRLYIAGSTPNSDRAQANLDAALCTVGRARRYRLEIVDVFSDARRAVADSIIVTPTLVARGLNKRLVMIGDLSDRDKLRGMLEAAAA